MTPAAFTLRELADCAAREAQMRERVYARLVERGRLKPETAEREIRMMQRIADLLQQIEAGDMA